MIVSNNNKPCNSINKKVTQTLFEVKSLRNQSSLIHHHSDVYIMLYNVQLTMGHCLLGPRSSPGLHGPRASPGRQSAEVAFQRLSAQRALVSIFYRLPRSSPILGMRTHTHIHTKMVAHMMMYSELGIRMMSDLPVVHV